MDVNTVTGAAAPGASPAQKAATLDYQAFLKLLIAEMQNQDPTEPMDTAQYIGQLASFSNVEQSIQANAKLDDILGSVALAQANAVIGRTVTSADGTTSGVVASVRLTSSGAVAELRGGGQVVMGEGVVISADE